MVVSVAEGLSSLTLNHLPPTAVGSRPHQVQRASMAKWLRSLTSNHLPLTAVGSRPHQGSYPANFLNVDSSPQVPSCALNNTQRGTWGLPPPVKLESHRMTFIVLVWHKPKNNQTNVHWIHLYDVNYVENNIVLLTLLFQNLGVEPFFVNFSTKTFLYLTVTVKPVNKGHQWEE